MSRISTDDLRRAGFRVQGNNLVPIANHKNENNTHNSAMGSSQPKCDSVQTLDGNDAAKKGIMGKARVRITRYGLRELDRDNLYGSCKGLIDGLVASGVISGDSPKDIELEVVQERVSTRKEIKTVIEIEEL